MPAFRDCMSWLGLRLSYGQRRLLFAMSDTNQAGRYKWYRQAQDNFNDATVGDCWFEDEIGIDWGGIPRGEWVTQGCTRAPHALVLNMGHA